MERKWIREFGQKIPEPLHMLKQIGQHLEWWEYDNETELYLDCESESNGQDV